MVHICVLSLIDYENSSLTSEISTVLQQFCLHTDCFGGLEKLKANSEVIKLVLSMSKKTSCFASSQLLVPASISSAVRLQVLLCTQLREKSCEGGVVITTWETPRESRTENGTKSDALMSGA